MRHVVGGRASQPEKQAASTSEVGRFETGIPFLGARMGPSRDGRREKCQAVRTRSTLGMKRC